MEEDIIKKFENFCEDLYYWIDDDMGGHFKAVVGDQNANTMLGYLSFKRNLENLLTRYKQQKAELESVKEIYYTQKEMEDVMIRYRKLVEENDKLKDKLKYKNEDRERLEKEICNLQDQISFYKKEVWNDYILLEERTKNYIPKSKIKEKIEARESSIADIKDNFVINEGMTIEIKRLETEIDVLQGLLKEEYEKGD